MNQEQAKRDILPKLDQSTCLLVMDWAMKFLQLRYREKENDWYGKRGLSWHISSVVSSSQNQEEDAECLQEDANRQDLIEKVNTELTVLHPICYDKFDMCECYHSNTLQEFSGAMLKIICSHFEIPVKLRDKKRKFS